MATASNDVHAEMPSFFSPFRKAHCMSNGLQTPPSSPESRGSAKHVGPKLYLSKFVQRAERDSPARSSTSRRTANTSTTPKSRTKHSSQSPFRAVREMKEPFPLILPDSPALTDESPRDSEKSLRGLRRVSTSYHDLRAVAQTQSKLPVSRLNTPLLPSPMILECGKEEASSYCAYPASSNNLVSFDQDKPEATYEVHRIISSYCKRERWSALLDQLRLPGHARQSSMTSSSIDHEQPYVQSKYDSPSASALEWSLNKASSNESDWLANTMSHEERSRRFKQRCYQVVQHPIRKGAPNKEEGKNKIMLATVLIGPGKPKLVQIERPTSSSKSSLSAKSLRKRGTQPATPVQRQKEISVFSPYDTPCARESDVMTPTMQQLDSIETVGVLYPAPLSVTPRDARDRADSAVYIHKGLTRTKIDDPFTTFPTDSQYTLTSTTTATSWSPSHARTTPPVSSPTREATAWSRCRKLERILEAVTRSIESFPGNLLILDSPTMRSLRKENVSEHVYVSHLRRIFPTISEILLSALAAWTLVDTFFLRLDLNGVSTPEQQTWDFAAASNESLHNIPEKARATLGIRLPNVTHVQTHERALRRRAQFVHVSVGVVAQRLMEAIRGRWEEDMWRAVRELVELVDNGTGEVVREYEGDRDEDLGEWM